MVNPIPTPPPRMAAMIARRWWRWLPVSAAAAATVAEEQYRAVSCCCLIVARQLFWYLIVTLFTELRNALGRGPDKSLDDTSRKVRKGPRERLSGRMPLRWLRAKLKKTILGSSNRNWGGLPLSAFPERSRVWSLVKLLRDEGMGPASWFSPRYTDTSLLPRDGNSGPKLLPPRFKLWRWTKESKFGISPVNWLWARDRETRFCNKVMELAGTTTVVVPSILLLLLLMKLDLLVSCCWVDWWKCAMLLLSLSCNPPERWLSDRDRTCRDGTELNQKGNEPVSAFPSSAKTRKAPNPARLWGTDPEIRLELAFKTWRLLNWLSSAAGRLPHNPTETSSIPCKSGNDKRVPIKALKLKSEDSDLLLCESGAAAGSSVILCNSSNLSSKGTYCLSPTIRRYVNVPPAAQVRFRDGLDVRSQKFVLLFQFLVADGYSSSSCSCRSAFTCWFASSSSCCCASPKTTSSWYTTPTINVTRILLEYQNLEEALAGLNISAIAAILSSSASCWSCNWSTPPLLFLAAAAPDHAVSQSVKTPGCSWLTAREHTTRLLGTSIHALKQQQQHHHYDDHHSTNHVEYRSALLCSSSTPILLQLRRISSWHAFFSYWQQCRNQPI